MDPTEIPLPKDIGSLIKMYILINKIINSIWIEYTCYCDSKTTASQTALIFPIIFHELDFYETLLNRISVHIPENVLKELEHDNDVWHW
jgi:hypothetical protein